MSVSCCTIPIVSSGSAVYPSYDLDIFEMTVTVDQCAFCCTMWSMMLRVLRHVIINERTDEFRPACFHFDAFKHGGSSQDTDAPD